MLAQLASDDVVAMDVGAVGAVSAIGDHITSIQKQLTSRSLWTASDSPALQQLHTNFLDLADSLLGSALAKVTTAHGALALYQEKMASVTRKTATLREPLRAELARQVRRAVPGRGGAPPCQAASVRLLQLTTPA